MPSKGPNSPATTADDASIGNVAWTNPGNAAASDASYATSILLITQTTHLLKCTNFGFAIPVRATITGILVEFQQLSTVLNGTTDNSVKIIKSDGTYGSTDKKSASLWPTVEAYASYGSSSDMWGESWTPWDINQVGFGVAISASATLASTAEIDHVRITVTYTEPNYPGNSAPFVRCGNLSRNDAAT